MKRVHATIGLSILGVLFVGLVAAVGWRVWGQLRDEPAPRQRKTFASADTVQTVTQRPTLPAETEPAAMPSAAATGSPAGRGFHHPALPQVAEDGGTNPPPRYRQPDVRFVEPSRPRETLSGNDLPPVAETAAVGARYQSAGPPDEGDEAWSSSQPESMQPEDERPRPAAFEVVVPAEEPGEIQLAQNTVPAPVVARPAPGMAGDRYGPPAPLSDRNGPAREVQPRVGSRMPGMSAMPGTSAMPGVSGMPGGSSMPSASRPMAPPSGKYVVQPNDSFWTISQKVYGTGGYFKALYYHNRERFPRPDRLEVGAAIVTPPVEELYQRYPNLCPRPERRATSAPRARLAGGERSYGGSRGRSYLVQEGDTLFHIAKFELGDVSRWGEIYELNRDLLGDDFDYLVPGSTLVLPEDEERINTAGALPEARRQ